MPIPRALLVAPLLLTLFGLGSAPLSSEPHPTPATAYLPRLVTEGGAPTAALLARRVSSAPYDTYRSTGPGIRRTDRFRAGSVTKTFVATVVLNSSGNEGYGCRTRSNDCCRGWCTATGTTAAASPCARCSATPAASTTTPPTRRPTLSATAAVRVALAHRPTGAPAATPTPTPTTPYSDSSFNGSPDTATPPRSATASSPPPSHRHLPPGRPYRSALPARPRLHPRSGRRPPARRHRARPAHGGRGR